MSHHKETKWSPVKSAWLKWVRGVSFEEVVEFNLIGATPHPARPNQNLLLYECEGRVWVVPFVETKRGRFLKTLYRSRKYTRKYRRGEL